MRGVVVGEFLACLHLDRVPLGSWTPPRAWEAPVCPGTRVGLGSRGCTRCAHPIFPLFLLPPPASGSPRSCSPTSRTATASQGTCSSASPQVSSHTAGTRWGHNGDTFRTRPSHGSAPTQPRDPTPPTSPAASRLHGTSTPWHSSTTGLPTQSMGSPPSSGHPKPLLHPISRSGVPARKPDPPRVLSLIPQATSSTTASTSSSTTSPARPGSTWCTTPW